MGLGRNDRLRHRVELVVSGPAAVHELFSDVPISLTAALTSAVTALLRLGNMAPGSWPALPSWPHAVLSALMSWAWIALVIDCTEFWKSRKGPCTLDPHWATGSALPLSPCGVPWPWAIGG